MRVLLQPMPLKGNTSVNKLYIQCFCSLCWWRIAALHPEQFNHVTQVLLHGRAQVGISSEMCDLQ